MYINNSTFIVSFVNPGLKSTHDIQISYVTYDTYFVTFGMPGVNSIYKLYISCIKLFVLWLIYLTRFSYQNYKHTLC